METQLLSLELLVTIKEGKVVELDPEFWFMDQNYFQKRYLRWAEKRAQNMVDSLGAGSQNTQSTSNKAALILEQLFVGQWPRGRYVGLLGNVPNRVQSFLLEQTLSTNR